MDAHADLLTELQLLDKVPTLERLRTAQKRRAQQLKKWAQYEKEMQHKKRKHEKRRSAVSRKKVSFEASVALLEASLRNDVEEDPTGCSSPASLKNALIPYLIPVAMAAVKVAPDDLLQCSCFSGVCFPLEPGHVFPKLSEVHLKLSVLNVCLECRQCAECFKDKHEDRIHALRSFQLKQPCEIQTNTAATLKSIPAAVTPEPKSEHPRCAGCCANMKESASLALKNMHSKVCYLLKNNISPDLCNEDGLTALHQCCIDNFEEIVKLLLNHGANVNAKDNELWTPLHAAATCGHINLVKILIQHGADLLAVNADGNMPYDLCEDEQTLDVIETCMAYQGITQEKINEMRAAPEQAMISDIRGLIAAGQDLNRTDIQGATLLHIAGANGYLHAAEMLLDHGARLDIQDWDGWEPLHAAAFWGQMQMAELLVSHGASLSARTAFDEMPIDLCEEEEFKVLLLELKHKHDVIMKSQMRTKSSLSRRTSSTGSRGKVVRRASLSDRTNLYRKEYEKEAIVWQQMGATEEQRHSGYAGEIMEARSDQENTDPNSVLENSMLLPELATKSTQSDPESSLQNGLRASASTYQYSVSNGDVWKMHTAPDCNTSQALPYSSPDDPDFQQIWGGYKDRSHQTLSELKRQRAAAKLLNHPFLSTHFGSSVSGVVENGGEAKEHLIDSRTSPYSPNGMSVYYTASSGDPPLLKFKAPMDEMEEKVHGCCRIS